MMVFFLILLLLSPQPLFSSLSRVWSGFQDEVVLLSVLSTLISGVKPFTQACQYIATATIIFALSTECVWFSGRGRISGSV